MDRLYMKARGKINLTLDVLKKRLDGYHDLKMVMQTVELFDGIDIRKSDQGIKVICKNVLVPEGDSNIAYKAAKALCEYTGLNMGIHIYIEKNIPVAAGMAGGSSDAAAVLKGVNELFSLGLTLKELSAIGRNIGADVPYCLAGGTMLAEGIGEFLTPLTPLNGVNVVLAKPRIEVSTAWVFKSLHKYNITKRPDTDAIINALERNDLKRVAGNLANVLELVTINEYPIIEEIKTMMLKCGALGSLMSGSGPTVFGLFEDEHSAQKAFNTILEKGQVDCYLTKTICEER